MKYNLALRTGDVIRTNPSNGYWGCAVVLSTFDCPIDREARCHIGVTPIVMRHEFTWSELDPEMLHILRFEMHYRPNPDVFGRKMETCITAYPNTRQPRLDIIASVDASSVYSGLLRRGVGGGEDGKFPLGSGIGTDLGMEAVISWRRVNDKDAFEAEIAASNAAYFAYEAERLRRAREKAKRRKSPGT